MKTTVYLVRHAEAQVNVDPMSSSLDILTEKGAREAQMLADRFRQIPIDAVYTSKVMRAQLTAREIGDAVNRDPVIVESLKERKVVYSDQHEYAHQESFDDLRLRLIETKSFLEDTTEAKIVVVSHALFLRALVGYITFGDLLTEELLHRITETWIIANAAVSKIEYNREKQQWRVDYWNDRRHLV